MSWRKAEWIRSRPHFFKSLLWIRSGKKYESGKQSKHRQKYHNFFYILSKKNLRNWPGSSGSKKKLFYSSRQRSANKVRNPAARGLWAIKELFHSNPSGSCNFTLDNVSSLFIKTHLMQSGNGIYWHYKYRGQYYWELLW